MSTMTMEERMNWTSLRNRIKPYVEQKLVSFRQSGLI